VAALIGFTQIQNSQSGVVAIHPRSGGPVKIDGTDDVLELSLTLKEVAP